MFEQEVIRQILTAAKLRLRVLVKEFIGDESKAESPRHFDDEPTGRMLGTSRGGTRKLQNGGEDTTSVYAPEIERISAQGIDKSPCYHLNRK
jgi:hypothetical protein